MPSAEAATITLSLEELDERAGLWCDSCLLPSRLECDFVMMVNGSPNFPFTYSCCTDCGEEVSGYGAQSETN